MFNFRKVTEEQNDGVSNPGTSRYQRDGQQPYRDLHIEKRFPSLPLKKRGIITYAKREGGFVFLYFQCEHVNNETCPIL